MKGGSSTLMNLFVSCVFLSLASPSGAQTIEVVDYSDTFTVAEWGGPIAQRTDGAYGSSGPRYNVEDWHGNPASVWTPQDGFSFNTGLGSTCCGYPSNDGNPGAASGLAQSGGTDFSFAYGLRWDYVVQMDSIFTFDRIDISSVPFPGAGIFSSPSLSVFFRNTGGFSLFNGATDTAVTDGTGTPINTGITDDGKWHNFAVRFDKLGGNLDIFVDHTLFASIDLNTFAGGIYRNFSNGAVGCGGAGYDFVNRVLWVDNFVVSGAAGPRYPRVTAFLDDFERPDGAVTGWSPFWGTTWGLQGGKLVAGPTASEHWIWAGAPPLVAPPNSTFEFDYAFLAAGTYPDVGRHGGFQFHCDRPTSRYNSPFSGYFIDWIDRPSDRGVRFTRVDSGALVELVPGQGAAAPTEPPAHFKVVTEGARIQVYGDGNLFIDIVDDTYRGGHFGFWTWEQGQQVAIDNVTLQSDNLAACFNTSTAFPLVDQTVTFDAACSSVFDGTTSIVEYDWDFGDGTTGTGVTVDHVYSVAETYAVTLTVEDSSGAVATITKEVKVSPNLAPLAACFNGPEGAPSDWTAALGTWTVTASGHLETTTGGAEAFLYAGDPVRYLPGNFVAEVDWKLFSGAIAGVGRHAAIHFFWNYPTANRFAADARGYALFYIDRASDRGLSLFRFAGGGYTVLNPPGGTPALTEPPLQVRIEVAGPRILVLADGVPVIDVTDGTYRDGLFGLWGYNENVVGFDDVRIWDGVEPEACPGTSQINGDCNLDGDLGIGDLVCYVLHLFPGFNLLDRTAPELPCPASVAGPGNLTILDVNGDAGVNVSDIVRLAMYLYMGGAPPVQGTGCFEVSQFLGCAENTGCQ